MASHFVERMYTFWVSSVGTGYGKFALHRLAVVYLPSLCSRLRQCNGLTVAADCRSDGSSVWERPG